MDQDRERYYFALAVQEAANNAVRAMRLNPYHLTDTASMEHLTATLCQEIRERAYMLECGTGQRLIDHRQPAQ